MKARSSLGYKETVTRLTDKDCVAALRENAIILEGLNANVVKVAMPILDLGFSRLAAPFGPLGDCAAMPAQGRVRLALVSVFGMINASWLAMIRVIEIAGTITMMTATQVVRGAPRTLVDID